MEKIIGRILKRYQEESGLTQRAVGIRCGKTERPIILSQRVNLVN